MKWLSMYTVCSLFNFPFMEVLDEEGEGSGDTVAANPEFGTRIAVLWSTDNEYYPGVIESYDERDRAKVRYFDGEVENLNLNEEVWRIESTKTNARTTGPNFPPALLGAPRVIECYREQNEEYQTEFHLPSTNGRGPRFRMPGNIPTTPASFLALFFPHSLLAGLKTSSNAYARKCSDLHVTRLQTDITVKEIGQFFAILEQGLNEYSRANTERGKMHHMLMLLCQKALPSNEYKFVIHVDNCFINPRSIAALRERGIGIVGTT